LERLAQLDPSSVLARIATAGDVAIIAPMRPCRSGNPHSGPPRPDDFPTISVAQASRRPPKTA